MEKVMCLMSLDLPYSSVMDGGKGEERKNMRWCTAQASCPLYKHLGVVLWSEVTSVYQV